MIKSIYEKDGDCHIVLANTVNFCFDDTKVLVTGVGHTGTNLLAGVIRASNQFNFYAGQEDRLFVSGMTLMVSRYGAKLALDSRTFVPQMVGMLMSKFPGLRILCSLRHPVDAVLSAGYRHQPVVVGGDATELETEVMLDAETTISNWKTHYIPLIGNMMHTYGTKNRALLYKMEDILTRPEIIAQEVAGFLNIPYVEEMSRPWEYNSHVKQQERYKGEKSLDQIDIYKRWDTIYDGFYADKKDYVFNVAEGLKDVAKMFDYKVEL